MNPAARGTPPAELLNRLRVICLDLPEAHEEQAWAGVRWNIGKKNFAHVVALDGGWPPAYARAAGIDDGVVCTFRLDEPQCAALRFRRAPFFRPVWFPNIAGVILDQRTDWDELESLVKASYRVLAPRRLAAQVS